MLLKVAMQVNSDNDVDYNSNKNNNNKNKNNKAWYLLSLNYYIYPTSKYHNFT